MKLVVSRLATRRLGAIAAYLQEHSPEAARRVQLAIYEGFVLIAAHPAAGRLHHLNVRRFVVPRIPYAIYYRVDQEAGVVMVITVRHAARRPL